MNKSIYHPLRNTVRLLLMGVLVTVLTLSTGQAAKAYASPAPVDLGMAANFVILTKTGVTNVSTSAITGNIGTSPIFADSITGFSLIADATNIFSTSSQVTGKIYAADYADPTPSNLTTAVSNMEAAFTNAAGRTLPDVTELGAGNISGLTLAPGLYKWGTGVLMTSDITLAGSSTDIWIFQISGDLTLGSGAQVLLSGGALASNVFWQVDGGTGVEIGTTAHVEGTILASKAIHLRTGASLNGRALSQTAVTLDQNTLVSPALSSPNTVLVNSILPSSRSVPVGTMATAFNTVINAGAVTAYGITLSMNPLPAGTFAYQQTNCGTNAIIGLPNPILDLAPGGVLCYVISFTPSAAFAATNVHIQAQATNAPSTNMLLGINTWLLRATTVAETDIIAMSTTTDFHQVSCSGANAFAIALTNVGATATGDITVLANTGETSLPLSILVMETDPATGAIIGDNILQGMVAGDNRTVAVFVSFGGCIAFDPAANRIFVEFRDASNNVVGSTSTAVSTNR